MCTQVHSPTKTKIIINSILGGLGKLFLNGKCLSIHHYTWTSQYYVTGYLEKGVNNIVLEMYNPSKTTLFSVQIRNYKFEMSDDFKALSNMGDIVQLDPLVLVSEPVFIPTKTSFSFMCFKNNNQEFEKDYTIDIWDSSTGFVRSLTESINTVIEIDLQELRNLDPESLRHQWLGCKIKYKTGAEYVTGLCLSDFDNRRNEIIEHATFYANQLDKEIYCAVRGRIERMRISEKNSDFQSMYWYTWQIKDIISSVESGTYHYNRYKTESGLHEFYIHSELDDSIIRMVARFPINYDANKCYPVILALSTGNDGWFSCRAVENIVNEPCLCFDITGRGFNGGSYIGEASTLEIIEWIRKNYKVDEDRVYILDQSSGGYATYSIAQNYPHLSAAIFPQIGNPSIETIENITNIPTYQMVSPKDHVFEGQKNQVKNLINKYGNYHQYDFREMIHHSFIEYIYHRTVLNDMMIQRRNLYPNEIIYKTCRNRHLKSFWIQINGIANGHKYAHIKANIENVEQIHIKVTGTKSVTVHIPPQINKESFSVTINKKVFLFEHYTAETVTFIKKELGAFSMKRFLLISEKAPGCLMSI